MVGHLFFIKMSKNICNIISHHTLLEYCIATKEEENPKPNETKLHNQKVYIKQKRNITVHYIKNISHFIKLYKFV